MNGKKAKKIRKMAHKILVDNPNIQTEDRRTPWGQVKNYKRILYQRLKDGSNVKKT